MRTLVVLSLLSLAAGCKGKPKHQEPPANLVGSGSATGSGGVKPAPDIALPKGTGAPPVKTTGPLDLATYEKLQKLTFPGFQVKPHGINANMGVEMRQLTEDHPRVWATVTIGPCKKEAILGDCTPMTLDAWKARSAELKASLLIPELRDLPDTVFEIGSTEINGVPFIYQYQLAQSKPAPQPAPGAGSGSAAKGSAAAKGSGSAAPAPAPGSFSWSHAYVLYYNDGQNQIRVVAEFKDDPMDSKEEMAKVVPRADLENVAKAFADVYTQAW